MKNTIFNKLFLIGFAMALVTFIAFNFLTFFSAFDPQIRNSVGTGGFPVDFYQWGGVPYTETFLINGFVIDLFVGIIYSSLVGAFFGYLRWRDFNKENEGALVEYKDII